MEYLIHEFYIYKEKILYFPKYHSMWRTRHLRTCTHTYLAESRHVRKRLSKVYLVSTNALIMPYNVLRLQVPGQAEFIHDINIYYNCE